MTRTRLRIFIALLVLLFGVTFAVAVMKTDTKTEIAHRDIPPSLLVIVCLTQVRVWPTPRSPCRRYLAHATGMQLSVDGQGGTGYISDAHGTGNGDTSKLIDRLVADGQELTNASVVVIDAGRNDPGYAVGRRWAAQCPITSTAPGLESPAGRHRGGRSGIHHVAGAIRRISGRTRPFSSSASKVGATLIDPIAEGSYQNADIATLVSADKVHPNADGARIIAARIRGDHCVRTTWYLRPHDRSEAGASRPRSRIPSCSDGRARRREGRRTTDRQPPQR